MSGKETAAPHTSQSLTHLAGLLEQHSAALRAAAVMMELEPSIPVVHVKYERMRVLGFGNVTTWVNAAKQAAFDARLAAANQKHPAVPAKSDTKKTRGRSG